MPTKKLSIMDFDFRDPAERALFREQQDALLTERKTKIVAELKRNGQLDSAGNLIFNEPLPADMEADSLADFKH